VNREQKRILGDAVFGQAMLLVEFFGEIGDTPELEAQGVTAAMVEEQLFKWLDKLPTKGN
jgi:hypothetical protein